MKTMKKMRLILALCILACTNVKATDGQTASVKAPALADVLHNRNPGTYTFSTKFGELKFVAEDGKLGVLAKSLTLGDKTLISVKGEKDAQGSYVYLMEELMKTSSKEYAPKIAGQTARPIKRMVVRVGPDGNCVKQFVILDFTGKQPFVSERFGYNPGDKSCLTFDRAKWRKRESFVYLEGPLLYAYNTGGKVIGPLANEQD
jgi:hypothetical protein